MKFDKIKMQDLIKIEDSKECLTLVFKDVKLKIKIVDGKLFSEIQE